MDAEQLLEHFDRVAEAPGSIAALRRFILDLAVRGKLVDQDPNDEPASELLKRIQVEKARLVKEGILKKGKQFLDVEKNEVNFNIPTNWRWVRIRQVTSDRGQTIPKSDFTYIDVTAINKELGYIADAKTLSASEAPSRARKLVQKNDVIYSCVRPYLLNIAIVDAEIIPPPIASTAFAILYGFDLVLPKYLWITLRSPFMIENVESKMRGQAYPAINDADFAFLPMPLPPLAEQHRIVAKVDELMDLCDRLEAAQKNRENLRDRLVAASLHQLNQAADSNEEFFDRARFYFDNLAKLSVRSEHIKQLRQTILNFAVSGKLVSQNSSDETALELLQQVKAEKTKLIKDGTIPNQKISLLNNSIKLTFDCPVSWEKINFSDVCNLVTSGSRGWAEYYSNTGSKFIRAQNIRFGKLKLDDIAHVKLPKKTEGIRTQLSQGDILIVITGAGVTNPALLDTEIGEAYVSQHVALVKPTKKELSQWLLLCLMAPIGGRNELVERAYGSGKPGLNLDNIRSLKIALPPLNEQNRIIAKVDELIALCDRLETQIGNTQIDSYQLLESLMKKLCPNQSKKPK